jgi:hypothetical protein
MDPKNEGTDVPTEAPADDGLGEHTGPTPATAAVETLSGEFGELEDPEAD